MGLKSAWSNTDQGEQFCVSEAVLNCLPSLFSNLYIRWSQIGSLKLIVCVPMQKTVTTVFSLNLSCSNTSGTQQEWGAGCTHREDKPSVNTWWSSPFEFTAPTRLLSNESYFNATVNQNRAAKFTAWVKKRSIESNNHCSAFCVLTNPPTFSTWQSQLHQSKARGATFCHIFSLSKHFRLFWDATWEATSQSAANCRNMYENKPSWRLTSIPALH